MKLKLYFAGIILLFGLKLNAQTTFPDIDVQHYGFSITLNDKNDTIKGSAAITIKFLNNVQQFKLNLVKTNAKGKGMMVSAITEKGKPVSFSQDADVINIEASAKNKSTHTFTINYSGIPADGLIISRNMYKHRTFFGDNWPNRAHNWLPCADYPADKATLDFYVYAPAHYQVVSNGIMVEEKNLGDSTKLTHWKTDVPLPTKVMVIGVADFAIQQSGDVEGIPVYSYIFPEKKEIGFKNYAYAPDILAWYIHKFGPYEYKKLANVQSKTIYGGMENSSAIFYYEESPMAGKADEELMAHEIAHQWFGDAASEKSFKSLWLSEGFATYMTNCYLEHKYGTDTLKKREIVDRRKIFRFERQRLTPVVDSAVTGNFVQLLNANSYEKGSWTLHMLRHKLGDTVFWQGIRAYYAKYEGKNANTDDFMQVMEQTSGQDLQQFFNQWLHTPGHPKLDVSWTYDESKGIVNISLTQTQSFLYQMDVEYGVDNVLHTIAVKDKVTTVQIPAASRPAAIKFDPDVNLLAEFVTQ